MIGRRTPERILALHPVTGGVAYVAFDAPLVPHRWGVAEVRGRRKNAKSLAAAAKLIDQLQPNVVVLANRNGSHDRTIPRVRRLHRLIVNYVEGQAIEVRCFDKSDIHDCFRDVGAVTRYEIAQSIAARIDVLKYRLPPVPTPWRSQTERLGLFDAAALAMTYYCRASKDEPLA